MTAPVEGRASLAGGLIVAAVAWGLTTGGTSALDLVVTICLLTGAWIACPRATRPVGTLGSTGAAAVIATMLVLGVGHDGLGGDGIRVAVLTATALLVALVGTSLSRVDRLWVVDGLIALGTLHAAVAVAAFATSLVSESSSDLGTRISGLRASPNTLAALLVATAAVTSWRASHPQSVRTSKAAAGPDRLWILLAIQCLGIVATGSRFGLLAVAGLLLWAARRTTSRLWSVGLVSAGFVGVAVVAVALVAVPTARIELWSAALRRSFESPWTGLGTTSEPLVDHSAGVPATSFAHNEILQVAIEFGVPLTIGLVVVVTAFVRRHHSSMDRGLMVAAAAVVASGMIDVTLRSTPVLIVAALCVGAATAPARARPDEVVNRRNLVVAGFHSRGTGCSGVLDAERY